MTRYTIRRTWLRWGDLILSAGIVLLCILSAGPRDASKLFSAFVGGLCLGAFFWRSIYRMRRKSHATSRRTVGMLSRMVKRSQKNFDDLAAIRFQSAVANPKRERAQA